MMVPDMVNITEAKLHDGKGPAQMVFDRDTVVVEDRAHFYFFLMAQRMAAENTFVTRIKDTTLYDTEGEIYLPERTDQDIFRDEVIQLSGKRAVETGMNKVSLRPVHVYKADGNKDIEIVTNNLDRSARTIADLYKK